MTPIAPRFHRKWLPTLRGGRGFSMIELLVVMIIFIIVMAAIYSVWFGLQRTYSFTNDDMRAQQQARTALNEMVEYIRTARQPDPAPSDEDLNVVIYHADANTLICWTDIDRDPIHDLELVRFRVDLTSRTLFRDDSQTGDSYFAGAHTVRMVSNWVSNNDDPEKHLFKYLAADGSDLGTPVEDVTLIRSVVIDLRIDVYKNYRPIAHQLRTVVQPRNLRQY